jgi:23S rRNA (guanosine2251-2'-O)-methyltransferase
MKKPNIIVLANNIRSIFNTGSIFRTADALGVAKIYLAGNMATPKSHPEKFTKTALGSDKKIPWEKIRKTSLTIAKYKELGFEIIALEKKRGKSLDYRNWKPSDKILLILGNEVTGIPNNTLKLCDKTIELPMNGIKESLNVGVSFGAIGYYILSHLEP